MTNDYLLAVELLKTSVSPKEGDPIDQVKLRRLADYFEDRYNLPSINMTHRMNAFNEKAIYEANVNRNVVLLLEKTPANLALFIKRADDESDIMVLYKNHYQCFNYEKEYDAALAEIHKVINPKARK